MTTAQEVEYEMIRSLKEWGVNPLKNEVHKELYDRYIRTVLLFAEGKKESENNAGKKKEEEDILEENKDEDENLFPCDAKAAIEYVLRSEFASLEDEEGQYRYILLDLLLYQDGRYETDPTTSSAVSTLPPNFYDQRRGIYRQQRAFLRYTHHPNLDPTSRFVTSSSVSSAQLIYHQWFVWNVVEGMSFEAAVAAHIRKCGIPCASCGTKHSILWSGGRGSGASWRDLHCRICQSTYEIKSKRTTQHIERDQKFNSIRSGSFYAFHQLRLQHKRQFKQLNTYKKNHNNNQIPSKKQQILRPRRFAVLVSRSCTWQQQRCGQRTTVQPKHRVDLFEIDSIVPRMLARSFVSKGDTGRLSISSEMRSCPSTWITWFYMPSILDCHYNAIATRIYDETFSKSTRLQIAEEWNSGQTACMIIEQEEDAKKKAEAEKTLLGNGKPAKQLQQQQQKQKHEKTDTGALRKALDALALDDWENDDSDH